MTPADLMAPLFRAAIALHLTGMAAAREDDVSAQVLTECAAATDAVNRAIAQLMVDHDLQPEDVQPLFDAITTQMGDNE